MPLGVVIHNPSIRYSEYWGFIYYPMQCRGNITKIPGENLQIGYNLHNLPQSITASDGTKVSYSYLSDGTKFCAVSDGGEKFWK